MQPLLADPHAFTVCPQAVVVPQAFSVLPISLSSMTCTATSLSLNFHHEHVCAIFFSIKWQALTCACVGLAGLLHVPSSCPVPCCASIYCLSAASQLLSTVTSAHSQHVWLWCACSDCAQHILVDREGSCISLPLCRVMSEQPPALPGNSL